MSAITEQFKAKVKPAFTSEQARADLNGVIKKVSTDQDMVECFRLYLTVYSPEARARLDSDARQRDRAIGYVLWLRMIDALASAINGFADLAPALASATRGEPDAKRKTLYPPKTLAQMPEMVAHWADLAFTNPMDPRPEIEKRSIRKQKEIRDTRGMIAPLVDAYRHKHSESPTLQQLLDFNPADDTLRTPFMAAADMCETLWRQYSSYNKRPAKPAEDNLIL